MDRPAAAAFAPRKWGPPVRRERDQFRSKDQGAAGPQTKFSNTPEALRRQCAATIRRRESQMFGDDTHAPFLEAIAAPRPLARLLRRHNQRLRLPAKARAARFDVKAFPQSLSRPCRSLQIPAISPPHGFPAWFRIPGRHEADTPRRGLWLRTRRGRACLHPNVRSFADRETHPQATVSPALSPR